MEELVKQLAVGFAENPTASGLALSELADRDWNEFSEAALSALTMDLGSQGTRYLIGLLLRDDKLAGAVSQPVRFSLAQATAITRIAASTNPRFEIQLARRLTSSTSIDEQEAVRVFEDARRRFRRPQAAAFSRAVAGSLQSPYPVKSSFDHRTLEQKRRLGWQAIE